MRVSERRRFMHITSALFGSSLPCLYYFVMRCVDYDVPVPHEEEPEPVQDFYEAVKTQEYYFSGKQIPLDHVDPMIYDMCLFAKMHAMFYEVLFHV